MTLKTYKKAMCASAFLAAVAMSGGAFAAGAAGDSFDFETGTFDSLSALSGNGSIAELNPGATSRPMPTATTTKVLEIAGTVTYTNDVSGTVPSNHASQVDFLFKVEPTDELENIEDGTVQVALAVGETNAVGTTADIKLWCKGTADGSAGWVAVKEGVTTGTWVRATLVLDYLNSKCKISFDGDFAAEKFLAGTASQSYVKSITMVGSTQIDEFVIKHDSLTSYDPYKDEEGHDITVPASDGAAVTLKYLNDYGIKQSEVNTVKNETSGMTVAQKYVAGLDPNSETKFELKTMTVSGNTATVTFPGEGSTYTVSVSETRNGGATSSTTTTSDAGTTAAGEKMNSATVTLPENGVGYIHLKATK